MAINTLTDEQREKLRMIGEEARARLNLPARAVLEPDQPPALKVRLTKQLEKFVDAALAIRETDALEVGAVKFTSPIFVLATLPHSEQLNKDGTKKLGFVRTNGDYSLEIIAGKEGLPYGVYPRLIFVYLISEAVKTANREVFLGHTFSDFLRMIGVDPRDARARKRVNDQLIRITKCRITCTGYKTGKKHDITNVTSIQNVQPIKNAYFWWSVQDKTDQPVLYNSSVVFTEEFFREIVDSPIPLDIRALQVLKGSAMAIDIYSWLTYSMYSLNKTIIISWKKLHEQFGSDYKRIRDFKKSFIEQLELVKTVYDKVKAEIKNDGICLNPSPTHIKRLQKN